METHLYPVLKELKLTPDQVVVGLHSKLRPPKSGDQAYLTFHTLNYSIYPQLMTEFFGLPIKPAKAGWNKWITDMQPFLEGLTTPVEVEAYRRWLADQEPEEEEESEQEQESEAVFKLCFTNCGNLILLNRYL